MAALFEPSHPPFWFHSHSPLRDVPLFFMAGPTRSDNSSHRANPLAAANPPRPPNAWILYRSDKLKDLPPPPPGMPRRPQADISKTISSMWKSESPEVRAQYERLSDIRKAEHQALYPGYRFQPMKKADKDRLRAEKLAERERERGARKSKRGSRIAPATDTPPLYTTEARLPSASAAPETKAGPSTAPAHPTPPPEHPTPRATPPPPPPATPATVPTIVAPQPGVLQYPPSPSNWQSQQQQQQQPDSDEFNALWLDHMSMPDFGDLAASQQEYLSVPLPNNTQYPLGWSPDDPSPQSDLPFFPPHHHTSTIDPLQAVLSPTDDPYRFDLGDFDVNELFDGSREIEITMGPNMLPSAFVDMNQYSAFTASLFADLDARPGADAFSFDPSAFDLAAHQEPALPPPPPAAPMPVPVPYVPPAGAANSSTRRVAADWRHIRLTPDSDSAWNQTRHSS